MGIASNGNQRDRWEEGDLFIQTELDPLTLTRLQLLQGKALLGVALWQDSIADEELEGDVAAEERVFVDLDLYLEDQNLLELYAATLYRGTAVEPIVSMEAIAEALERMTEQEAILTQVTSDEQDGLVLSLATPEGETLTIVPSGWALDEWEELPDEGP